MTEIFYHYFPDDCILSADQMIDAADTDSLSNLGYWIRYGNRLGLDFLIIAESNSVQQIDSLSLVCWDYHDKCFLNDYHASKPESDSIVFLQTKKISSILKKSPISFEVNYIPHYDENAYWQGRYHFLLKQDSLALQYFNLALNEAPGDSMILLKKAETLVCIGQNDQIQGKSAETLFLEAEEIVSSFTSNSNFQLPAALLKARIYVNQSSWNRAEAAINESMDLSSTQFEIYLLLSRLHPSRYAKFGFKSRKQLYEKAREINPANVLAYLSLGDWYYYHHEITKAEKIYHQLLTINPHSLDGLLALGKIYLYRNESIKLIETYERVLNFYPRKPEILYNLGIAYFNEGNYPKAISLFNTAANKYKYANAYYYLGVTYIKLGQHSEAIAAFRQRILARQGPNDVYANEAVKYLYQLLHPEKENAFK